MRPGFRSAFDVVYFPGVVYRQRSAARSASSSRPRARAAPSLRARVNVPARWPCTGNTQRWEGAGTGERAGDGVEHYLPSPLVLALDVGRRVGACASTTSTGACTPRREAPRERGVQGGALSEGHRGLNPSGIGRERGRGPTLGATGVGIFAPPPKKFQHFQAFDPRGAEGGVPFSPLFFSSPNVRASCHISRKSARTVDGGSPPRREPRPLGAPPGSVAASSSTASAAYSRPARAVGPTAPPGCIVLPTARQTTPSSAACRRRGSAREPARRGAAWLFRPGWFSTSLTSRLPSSAAAPSSAPRSTAAGRRGTGTGVGAPGRDVSGRLARPRRAAGRRLSPRHARLRAAARRPRRCADPEERRRPYSQRELRGGRRSLPSSLRSCDALTAAGDPPPSRAAGRRRRATRASPDRGSTGKYQGRGPQPCFERAAARESAAGAGPGTRRAPRGSRRSRRTLGRDFCRRGRSSPRGVDARPISWLFGERHVPGTRRVALLGLVQERVRAPAAGRSTTTKRH